MSKYFHHKYVSGGTKKEVQILSNFVAKHVQKEIKLSRWLYINFTDGKEVPEFVRDKIEKFLEKKKSEMQKILFL